MTLHNNTGTPVSLSNVKTRSSLNTAVSAVAITIQDGDTDVLFIEATNPNTADAYVQMFNVASGTAITLGTTVPDYSFMVPAGTSTTVRGRVALAFVCPLRFSLGLKVAMTTTMTGSTSNAAANSLQIQVR